MFWMWRGSANDLTSEELLDDAWQSEEEGEKKLDGCEEGDEGACGEAETWWKERKQVKYYFSHCIICFITLYMHCIPLAT